MRLPKPQKHKKASLSELLALALFLVLIGLDLSKGYLLAQALLRPYFPSLPHLSRFLRVLQNAPSLLAHLALRLAQGPSLLHVVDSKIRATPVTKPLPMALGHRIRGYALVGVIHDRGLFHRWALLPGNARESWARELLEGLERVLGDRGGKLGPSGLTRWVEGVLTPPYRLRGG